MRMMMMMEEEEEEEEERPARPSPEPWLCRESTALPASADTHIHSFIHSFIHHAATTLHCITLHQIVLHCIELHCVCLKTDSA